MQQLKDTFTFDEFDEAMKYIQEYFGDKTEVLPGVGESKDLNPYEIRITVIGAGKKKKVGEDSTTEETLPKLHYTVDETGTSLIDAGDYFREKSEVRNRTATSTTSYMDDDFEVPTYLRRRSRFNPEGE